VEEYAQLVQIVTKPQIASIVSMEFVQIILDLVVKVVLQVINATSIPNAINASVVLA